MLQHAILVTTLLLCIMQHGMYMAAVIAVNAGLVWLALEHNGGETSRHTSSGASQAALASSGFM